MEIQPPRVTPVAIKVAPVLVATVEGGEVQLTIGEQPAKEVQPGGEGEPERA